MILRLQINSKQILEAIETQVDLDEDEVEGDNEPNSLLKAHDQAAERGIDELSEGETEWEADDGLRKAQLKKCLESKCELKKCRNEVQ